MCTAKKEKTGHTESAWALINKIQQQKRNIKHRCVNELLVFFGIVQQQQQQSRQRQIKINKNK